MSNPDPWCPNCPTCKSTAIDSDYAGVYRCAICKKTFTWPEPKPTTKSQGQMSFSEFDKYQEGLLKQVVIMKDTKGKEYAHSEDRFANFNRLADRLSEPNIKIAWVYLTKHLDSIESYVREGKTFSNESIQGRIVDAITYLTLIGGMIKANGNK